MGDTSKYQQVAKPYRVLSLDGGGMRGVYTAAFLARLTDQFGRIRSEPALDLGRGFDLITGTSTGAIVGCALAVGRPMSQIVALYREHGRKIFPHRIAGGGGAIFRVTQGSRYVRAGDKALRKALEAVLSDTTMLDVYHERGISLCVPAVLMSEHRAWVFKKTPCSGVRDENYPLVDVCMATSAAPIYRSLAAIDDPDSSGGPKQVFADGGLWANNPILVGLVDALTIAEPDRPIEIFSLGTCPRPVGDHFNSGSEHRSMLDWSLGADVAPLSISAQEFAFDHMARLLANAISSCGRPIRKVRFPQQACACQHDAVSGARRHPAGCDGSLDYAGPHRRRSHQECLRRFRQRRWKDDPASHVRASGDASLRRGLGPRLEKQRRRITDD